MCDMSPPTQEVIIESMCVSDIDIDIDMVDMGVDDNILYICHQLKYNNKMSFHHL